MNLILSLKYLLRNIKKNPIIYLMNIFGLVLTFACSFLIAIWVIHEFSYDDFHKNGDNICRIIADEEGSKVCVTPIPLASYLKENLPEVKNATRIKEWIARIKYKENSFYEKNILVVDPSFIDIFSFDFISRPEANPLSNPDSILITERMAKKYFGNQDPIGKTVRFSSGLDLKVTAVLRDIPENSHLKFDFLFSFLLLKKYGFNMDDWEDTSYHTYILTADNINMDSLAHKIQSIYKDLRKADVGIVIQKLSRVHLYSDFKWDFPGQGNILQIYILILAATLILIIGVINLISLNSSLYTAKMKEFAIMKICGSSMKTFIPQIFLEVLIQVAVSLVLSIALVAILLPVISNSLLIPLSLSSVFTLPGYISIFLGILVICGFTTLYPLFAILRMNTSQVIKDSSQTLSGGLKFRKGLVLVQFSISICLMIFLGFINHQLSFITHKNLGYSSKNIIYSVLNNIIVSKPGVIKNMLLESPDIENVTYTDDMLMTSGSGTSNTDWPGKGNDDPVQFQLRWVDEDYIDTFGMQMISGHFFTKDIPSELKDGIVLNETAVKVTGLKNPIGKWLIVGEQHEGVNKIIGVVKDFHFTSLHRQIEPLGIIYNPKRFNYLCIKFKDGSYKAALSHIRNVWEKVCPEYPLDISFLDEQVHALYGNEYLTIKIISFFNVVGIFISILGLSSLAFASITRRTKEIGIRKVLGATIIGLVRMLSGDFTRNVLYANIIAWPLAYYLVARWLETFHYRVDINFIIFLGSGLLTLIISLFVVSFYTIKASLINPIQAIRHE
ncbi:MAG: ABC transporter permease [Acidobacteria bacterium]|nr:ABC transporter permease [Acidobacteriota bacterium]